MINFEDYANENKTGQNSKWPYILDHSSKILIIGVLNLEKQMYY